MINLGPIIAFCLIVPTAFGDAPLQDERSLAVEGFDLSEHGAAELELALQVSPDDLDARTRLLGYYFNRAFDSPALREARQRHAGA